MLLHISYTFCYIYNYIIYNFILCYREHIPIIGKCVDIPVGKIYEEKIDFLRLTRWVNTTQIITYRKLSHFLKIKMLLYVEKILKILGIAPFFKENIENN